MKKALFAACLLWLVAARPVVAQAFLEQLEQQIRKQASSADGSTTASQGPAMVQPPANPPAGSGRRAAVQPGGASAQERGYLGVVTDDRLDRGRGVRITEVRPGGPAEKAGLKAQDLITGLAGLRVRQMADLAAILEQAAPGGSLKFEILRGTQSMQLDVTFGKRPDAKSEATPPLPRLPPEKPADLNLAAPSFADQPKPSSGSAAGGLPPGYLPTPAPPAVSESAPSDRARIEALERRVKALEERLQQLEREKSAKK